MKKREEEERVEEKIGIGMYEKKKGWKLLGNIIERGKVKI